MDEITNLYNSVKPYMDKDGWFPDDILGESFWVLSYCKKKSIGDKLYWKFVKHDEINQNHQTNQTG